MYSLLQDGVALRVTVAAFSGLLDLTPWRASGPSEDLWRTGNADMEIGCGVADSVPEAGNTSDFPIIYVVGRKVNRIERLGPPTGRESGQRFRF